MLHGIVAIEKLKHVSNCQFELSDQARRHALFPLLDFIVKSSHTQQKQMDGFSIRLLKVERDCSQIIETQKELEKMIKNFGESTFDIKKSIYQVYLSYIFYTMSSNQYLCYIYGESFKAWYSRFIL